MAERQETMEAILTLFRDYIRESPIFDIVFSPKIGYLYIPMEITVESCRLLESPEELVETLCYEIQDDVLDLKLEGVRRDAPSDTERAEIRRRFEQILAAGGPAAEFCGPLMARFLGDD